MALSESYVKRRTRQGLVASLWTRDSFGRYIAVGVTTMSDDHCADVLQHQRGAGPAAAKGIPLPFISYGGSSLFVMLASVGVLLNVSQQTE
ncbi:MAG TPA: FtsW/RodA/SpoVE family cell cycle protein [Candidatus Polarisedimenticolia bacterium]|nr:FtsW/RodA/SpoVE family cell cycle protein [Candidatus Polarisedimenticolia bacterium]